MVKRVVCGPDAAGSNTILLDEALQPLGGAPAPTAGSAAPPAEVLYVAWASEPVHSTDDITGRPLDLKLKPGETRFLRVEIAPHTQGTFHRTPYITDYLVALSGSLTMVAEDGSSATIGPGDMLVQIGGWHQWRNDGDEPFVMSAVVVGVETDSSAATGVEYPTTTGDAR